MGRNIGVALGPILGGLVLAKSYNIGLLAAASTLAVFGLITFLFLHETCPTPQPHQRKAYATSSKSIKAPCKTSSFPA
jgi:predicted MFS family arabinose efflux permease